MAYLTLSIELGTLQLERVEAACFELGALAVTLSDCRDDAVLEPLPGELRLWPATRVQALYPAEAATPRLIQQLAQSLQIPVAAILAGSLGDRVWEREWLRDFHAMRFGRRLWVRPSHESVNEPDAIVIELDPGLAFGTGTHPSTAMCLHWLDAQPAIQGSVIDYGCGSGILGIAAARLGAQQVQSFDIDPQALLATRENAERNGVSQRVRVVAEARQLQPSADFLVANILAGTLIELAAELRSLMCPGGRFVLAGILAEQEDSVIGAFASWSAIGRYQQSGDWVSLAGTRVSGAPVR